MLFFLINSELTYYPRKETPDVAFKNCNQTNLFLNNSKSATIFVTNLSSGHSNNDRQSDRMQLTISNMGHGSRFAG